MPHERIQVKLASSDEVFEYNGRVRALDSGVLEVIDGSTVYMWSPHEWQTVNYHKTPSEGRNKRGISY